jgi:hypothetical protein
VPLAGRPASQEENMKRIFSIVAVATAGVGLAWIVPARSAARPDDLKQQHAKAQADKIEQLYEDLVSPTPTLILTGQKSVADIFDPAVRGRVTPVGQFLHAEAVNEYFFGLATTPTSRVTRVEFHSLAASGDKVAVEVDIHFERSSGGGFTLRQTGFFAFNADDRVSSFDLTILNLGAAVNPRSDAEREANIRGVCAVLTTGLGPGQPPTCPGTYSDFSDCYTFMHSIPYGTWDRANSNTFVCRQLHTLLTPYRPAMHCPHAGKTGGGACVEFTYESFFDEEF